jgi:hypothetical protein
MVDDKRNADSLNTISSITTLTALARPLKLDLHEPHLLDATGAPNLPNVIKISLFSFHKTSTKSLKRVSAHDDALRSAEQAVII